MGSDGATISISCWRRRSQTFRPGGASCRGPSARRGTAAICAGDMFSKGATRPGRPSGNRAASPVRRCEPMARSRRSASSVGLGVSSDLPESRDQLRSLRKGDPRKVISAVLVKALTSVKNDWIAKRLCMGHPAAMSQRVNRARKDPKTLKLVKKHEKTFKSKD